MSDNFISSNIFTKTVSKKNLCILSSLMVGRAQGPPLLVVGESSVFTDGVYNRIVIIVTIS